MIRVWFLLVGLFMGLSSFGQYDSIPFDGLNRTFLLRLPPSYDGSIEMPLVIAMHGGFGSADNLENQSLLTQKGEAENFIVVYPEGVASILNIRTWNAGGCCGFAANTNVDDVGFINALIDTLLADYAIDEQRIYATGMSNGGFMSYRLACELSDRIAAIAPVACSMLLEDCEPLRPVPVIHFHSLQDSSIPYLGGEGDGPSSHHNPPQDSVMNVWASKDGCTILNEVVADNDEYTFTRWRDCECLTEVHHYITSDGGHSWPGGTATFLGDPVSEYINANDLMWNFFTNHSLDCNITYVHEKELNVKLVLTPNPSQGVFYFESDVFEKTPNIAVFNTQGVQIPCSVIGNQIQIEHAPTGLYIVLLRLGQKLYSGKVCIN